MIITSRECNPYNTRVTPLQLEKRTSQNAGIESIENGWRLNLESGQARSYRLAQLDDYGHLSRGAFPHRPPLHLSVKARASQNILPGTWGFGLWNDPFGLSLGFGATARRLPSLPNAAWFFFASPENYLSFHNGLAGNGAMASVNRSPQIPAPFIAFNLPLLPLLAWPPGSRWLRRRASQYIQQDAIALEHDQTIWHQYGLTWETDAVGFMLDDKEIFKAHTSPIPPLGLVIWIDNQYAAWLPDGRLRYGLLPTPNDCWVEIKDLRVH